MLRSALAAALLLAALLLSGATADAHPLARPRLVAPSPALELVTVSSSPTHDGAPCRPDGPLCCPCPAGVCALVGCLTFVEPAFFPITAGKKAAYALFEGSRPAGTGVAPDLPPPRAII